MCNFIVYLLCYTYILTLQLVFSVCDSPELSSPLMLCAILSVAGEARCTEIGGIPKKMRED